MRTLLAIVLIAGSMLAQAAGTASMAGPAPIIVQGFQTPESVLYDSRADVYLVSNINGPAVPRNVFAVDGNGFVSRVSPSGKVLGLKWIDGTKKGQIQALK
ncbi:MAG: hypothetical protein ACRDFW_07825 [bacterium]